MRCPHCEQDVRGPRVGFKLTCPECDAVLIELERELTEEEIKALEEIINLAIEDPEFRERLLERPTQELRKRGIDRATLDYLSDSTQKVFEVMGLPEPMCVT